MHPNARLLLLVDLEDIYRATTRSVGLGDVLIPSSPAARRALAQALRESLALRMQRREPHVTIMTQLAAELAIFLDCIARYAAVRPAPAGDRMPEAADVDRAAAAAILPHVPLLASFVGAREPEDLGRILVAPLLLANARQEKREAFAAALHNGEDVRDLLSRMREVSKPFHEAAMADPRVSGPDRLTAEDFHEAGEAAMANLLDLIAETPQAKAGARFVARRGGLGTEAEGMSEILRYLLRQGDAPAPANGPGRKAKGWVPAAEILGPRPRDVLGACKRKRRDVAGRRADRAEKTRAPERFPEATPKIEDAPARPASALDDLIRSEHDAFVQARLDERERAIVARLEVGDSIEDIARDLALKPRRIRQIRAGIRRKLRSLID